MSGITLRGYVAASAVRKCPRIPADRATTARISRQGWDTITAVTAVVLAGPNVVNSRDFSSASPILLAVLLRAVSRAIPSLQETDLAEFAPDPGTTRVPVPRVHAAWQRAEALAGPDVGLLTARELHVGDIDPQGYVLNAAGTLRDALELAGRYHRLFYDNVSVASETVGDTVTVRFQLLDGGEVPHSLLEFAVAALCRIARFVFGSFPITEVRFQHVSRASGEAFDGTFGCPVHQGAAETCIQLPVSALDLRNAVADHGVGTILAEHLQRELGLLQAQGVLAGLVHGLLVRELPLRGTGAIDVARELSMSERTLRRRLADEGTSHRRLLEEARREVAIRLLGEQRLSIDEVAYHLGYAQPSSFQRAFKRWTGMPPATFRVRCGRASTMPPRA